MEAYRDQYASLFNDGQGVALLAISTDDPTELRDWAVEAEIPFTFASDPGAVVGRRYGAFRQRSDGSYVDNRTVFVIDPDGVIRWVAAPFLELDPMAYEALGAAVDEVAAPDDQPSGS